MHALFIMDEFPCHDPKLGPTNNVYNVIGSYLASRLGAYDLVVLGRDVCSDAEVDRVLREREYDFAFISPNVWNVSIHGAAELSKAGKKIIVCWGDSVNMPDAVSRLTPYIPAITWDAGLRELSHNCIGLETPQDPRYFYSDPSIVPDIDVSLLGTVRDRRDRREIVSKLQAAGIAVHAGGGRTEDNYDIQTYTNLIRRSKLCLNTAANWNVNLQCETLQRKGRVFEVAACGRCLLTDHPEILEYWFNVNCDYFAFTADTVVDVVRQYLSDDAERERAARDMHAKYHGLYTPEKFWGKVIEVLQIKS